MYLAEGLQNKWAPVLDHEDMPKIKDSYRKAVTAVLLENQEKAMAEEHGMGNFGFQQLHEAPAPVNAAPTGSGTGLYVISKIRWTRCLIRTILG